jgi:hypothetical protein
VCVREKERACVREGRREVKIKEREQNRCPLGNGQVEVSLSLSLSQTLNSLFSLSLGRSVSENDGAGTCWMYHGSMQ